MPKDKNETRLRNAGLRMAMKLIPEDLMLQAPATLEKYLLNQLTDVEPFQNEAGACYLIAPDNNTGALLVMLVALDEQSTVTRVVKKQTISELFRQIIEGIKEL